MILLRCRRYTWGGESGAKERRPVQVMKRKQMEQYFKEYYPLAYRVAFAQVKNRADAEDIAQEVFIRLLLSEKDYESAAHEKAWMIRVTLNLCKDLLKSRWRNLSVALETVPEQERKSFGIPCLEEDDTLWAVLALAENYRNCLYLFYYEDYSIREIAAILDLPENTVKTNLRRGREKIRELLQRERGRRRQEEKGGSV